MPPDPLVLEYVVVPQLVPTATVPNDDLWRALTEPLAEGRTDDLYLLCTHPRTRVQPDSVHPAGPGRTRWATQIAQAGPYFSVRWKPWFDVDAPQEVRPSEAVPWALIDPGIAEEVELIQLAPDDPDGEDAPLRVELLGWTFERLAADPDSGDGHARGRVSGGRLDLTVEYVGQTSSGLKRPAGAHHKTPLILWDLLVARPWRLLHLMPCEVRYRVTDGQPSPEPFSPLPPSLDLPEDTVKRSTLLDAVEQALIASFMPEWNEKNKVSNVFPASYAGQELRAAGLTHLGFGFGGLPVSSFSLRTATKAHDGTTGQHFALG